MSNKLKYIIFFGAIFGLLGFAHSIRCSETPIISSLVGWLTMCTAVFYFSFPEEFKPIISVGTIKMCFELSPAKPLLIGALAFSALQHAFIYTDMYMVESVSAALFFVWFYYVLGKAADG